MERPAGFEPAYRGWKPRTSPLGQGRNLENDVQSPFNLIRLNAHLVKLERVKGIEPSTFCLASKRSASELHPHVCVAVQHAIS